MKGPPLIIEAQLFMEANQPKWGKPILQNWMNFDTLVTLTRGVAPPARVEAEAHTFLQRFVYKLHRLQTGEKTLEVGKFSHFLKMISKWVKGFLFHFP